MERTLPFRRALAAACAVAALALAPAAASAASPAERWPVGGTSMRSAYDTAVKFWGGAPCGSAVQMSWVGMDPSFNAVSSWMAVDDAPASTFTDCRIEFNPNAEYDAPKLCTIMVHEVGHLLGRGHDHAPGRLMSEIYAGPVPACAGFTGATTAASRTATARTAARRRRARAATRRTSAGRARSAARRSARRR